MKILIILLVIVIVISFLIYYAAIRKGRDSDEVEREAFIKYLQQEYYERHKEDKDDQDRNG